MQDLFLSDIGTMRPSEFIPVFKQDEINSINAFQLCGFLRPLVCPGQRTAPNEHLDGQGKLIATPDGLICPYCAYTQEWAPSLTKHWAWKKMFLFSTAQEATGRSLYDSHRAAMRQLLPFRELESTDNLAVEYSKLQARRRPAIQKEVVMSPASETNYTRNDIRPGAIFTTPDNIQCRVDRMEGEKVHLTVMNNKEIEGKHEITLSLNELQNNRWKLTKQAA